MTRGKAEDAGGLTPAKDDNAAPYHFDRRTLPIFKCVDYIIISAHLHRAQPGSVPAWQSHQQIYPRQNRAGPVR